MPINLNAIIPHWQAYRKIFIFPLRKYFKSLKDVIIVTASTQRFQSFTFYKVGKTMSKYGHLMLPGGFPDKFTTDTDFIDEAVLVQCYDVPIVKILE